MLEIGLEIGASMSRDSLLHPGSSSDHAPFEDAGIPVAFLLADDASRIHTPEDTLDFIDRNLVGWSAEISITLLDRLAARPDA